LAIELAAARTRVLPLHEIARRLEDRFALLRDPNSPLPSRRSTLLAALTWSYDLLFPDDQRGLWALAAFTGGAPLSAVEDVLAALEVPKGAALDVVARLVDRSLAIADVGAPGAARYRLLDSVRALSRERLHEAGLSEHAAAAHAAWVARAAERARTGVRGPGQPVHLAFARAERANIDAALAWCAAHEPDLGLRIALGFGWTWVVLGTGVEGAHKVRAALDAAAPGEEDRAAALTLCGWFQAASGDLERAADDLRTAIEIGDARAGAIARLHLTFVHTQAGRTADALEVLAACRPELHRLGLAWEEGASWLLGAWAHIASGHLDAGRAACDQAVELLDPLGDSWALAHAQGLLGELAAAEQRYTDAVEHLARAAGAAQSLGFEAAQAHHLLNLGLAQQASGDVSAGRDTIQQAVDVSARCGDTRTEALARARLAQAVRDAGDSAAATDLARSAADLFHHVGGGDGARLVEYLLAALRADTDAVAGLRYLQDVLERARRAGDTEVHVLTLDALARLDASAGHVREARSRIAEADVLAGAAPFRWARNRVDRERAGADLAAIGSRTV
jgi:tetratricopeptide (TPR) repeat protein